MIAKVLAYVVRTDASDLRLLVFEHAHHPNAGLQVPAGTVEAGELPEAALWRELAEESGLRPPQVTLVGKLAEFPQPEWDLNRYVYLLRATDGLPSGWRQSVTGSGEDAGLIFEYRWEALSRLPRLAGDQDRWLPLIAATLAQARS
jgi:8-oxo-dGTP diphosphatase